MQVLPVSVALPFGHLSNGAWAVDKYELNDDTTTQLVAAMQVGELEGYVIPCVHVCEALRYVTSTLRCDILHLTPDTPRPDTLTQCGYFYIPSPPPPPPPPPPPSSSF